MVKTNVDQKGEALDMYVDQELTGGHSQYELQHFQENERPSYPGLNINYVARECYLLQLFHINLK